MNWRERYAMLALTTTFTLLWGSVIFVGWLIGTNSQVFRNDKGWIIAASSLIWAVAQIIFNDGEE